MADIIYTRNVTFADYVDGETVVSAGGADGFNARFHGLEGEFDTLAVIVGQINAALKKLAVPPTPTPTRINFTPNMVATSAAPWTHLMGLAQKPPGAASAQGMMSVSLPHGATIGALRVIGGNSGLGSLRVTLFRQSLAVAAQTMDIVAQVTASNNPGFDTSAPAAPSFMTVDDTAFKYFVAAQLDNAAPADTVTLSLFQIAYTPSP